MEVRTYAFINSDHFWVWILVVKAFKNIPFNSIARIRISFKPDVRFVSEGTL